jgi:phage shock protein A
MKRIPKALYQTADEIEARIKEREDDALLISPESDEHRAIMKEIAQLRVYAEAKRWISSPGLQPAAGTSKNTR